MNDKVAPSVVFPKTDSGHLKIIEDYTQSLKNIAKGKAFVQSNSKQHQSWLSQSLPSDSIDSLLKGSSHPDLLSQFPKKSELANVLIEQRKLCEQLIQKVEGEKDAALKRFLHLCQQIQQDQQSNSRNFSQLQERLSFQDKTIGFWSKQMSQNQDVLTDLLSNNLALEKKFQALERKFEAYDSYETSISKLTTRVALLEKEIEMMLNRFKDSSTIDPRIYRNWAIRNHMPISFIPDKHRSTKQELESEHLY